MHVPLTADSVSEKKRPADTYGAFFHPETVHVLTNCESGAVSAREAADANPTRAGEDPPGGNVLMILCVAYNCPME